METKENLGWIGVRFGWIGLARELSSKRQILWLIERRRELEFFIFIQGDLESLFIRSMLREIFIEKLVTLTTSSGGCTPTHLHSRNKPVPPSTKKSIERFHLTGKITLDWSIEWPISPPPAPWALHRKRLCPSIGRSTQSRRGFSQFSQFEIIFLWWILMNFFASVSKPKIA
jgi:hypothetical protein